MTRKLFAAAALIAAGVFAFHGVARAGDEAPKAPVAAPAPAPAATPATPTTPATPAADAPKTANPIFVIMGWVGKQVAPSLECACPSKPEGEAAWRGWFAGGKDIPLAGLRDALVADGWTADKTVAFFKDMASKMANGECKDCKDCAGKGECKDCHGGKAKEAAKPDATPAKPVEAPAKP